MRKNSLASLLIAAGFTALSISAHANLKSATVAFTSGNWKVLRDQDTMTDKMNCTGIYRDDYGVQLTAESLYIKISGGVESVTLRFGEDQVRPLRLATEMEKKVRVIILTGTDLEQLQTVSRLRYQASTLVSGIKTGELDLKGFSQALENIKAGCPLQTPASAPSAQKNSEALTGSTCNAELISRMRQQGLKDRQISSICQ
jgi:hypothetical protein